LTLTKERALFSFLNDHLCGFFVTIYVDFIIAINIPYPNVKFQLARVPLERGGARETSEKTALKKEVSM